MKPKSRAPPVKRVLKTVDNKPEKRILNPCITQKLGDIQTEENHEDEIVAENQPDPRLEVEENDELWSWLQGHYKNVVSGLETVLNTITDTYQGVAEQFGFRSETILLQCVSASGRLRIRFHSYTDCYGKTYTNVYNNEYNCDFPKDIRVEGRYYEVGRESLTFVQRRYQRPFYRINTWRGIRTMPLGWHPQTGMDDVGDTSGASSSSNNEPAAVTPNVLFEVNECVICLSETPDTIFIPCAHLCTCSECYTDLAKELRPQCPLCRRTITATVANTK